MRAIHEDNNNPFQKALARKNRRKDFDARAASHAANARRNVRQLPTRQLNRGR
ncbi:hypothetical protein ACSNOI_21795 [Actinomadura kijaniata]|uniref:hypothetical protein n=1 Tax=Actinomadura kijaniata TaxID=46161 RepID=UPI003F198B19